MKSNISSSRQWAISNRVRALGATLESRDEMTYAIQLLRRRGRVFGKHVVAAHETLSRQFLQQRHQLYGLMAGPWPVEFEKPLEVWHRKRGFDFSVSKAFTKEWLAQISRAQFVKLGKGNMARYVELQLPIGMIIPLKSDRVEYGYKDNAKVPVYCTLRTLITARPKWVLNAAVQVRIARARVMAEKAAKQLQELGG